MQINALIYKETPIMSSQSRQMIPIFYAADDAYAPMLAVSIRSLLDNADKSCFYRIHILTSTMCENYRKRIAALETENSRISFDDASARLSHVAHRFAIRDYYSIATYYRLFIADMFPEYDKALYIDSDTVVPGDISQMYSIDIGSCLVGATSESVMLDPVFGKYSEVVLGIKHDRYFNAGILIMNLAAFRSEKMEKQFLKLLGERSFPVAQDQDYLNVLCHDRVHYFDRKWNLDPMERFVGIEPCLVHYKMAMRPWNYDGIIHGDIFWKYAETSGFYEIICEIKKNRTEKDALYDKSVYENLSQLALEEIARASEAQD